MSHQSQTRTRFGEFVHQLYEARDVAGAFARFVGSDYVQHNPGLPDGPAAAVAMLTGKFADPELRLTVRRILWDGDIAAVLIHGEIGDRTRFAVVDIYRIEGPFIVEHWDVIQPFPASIHNDHPFFS